MTEYQFSMIISCLFLIAGCAERIAPIKFIFMLASLAWMVMGLTAPTYTPVVINHL